MTGGCQHNQAHLHLEGAWGRITEISEDELKERLDWYDGQHKPLGRSAWAFGLWVIFETWTTAN